MIISAINTNPIALAGIPNAHAIAAVVQDAITLHVTAFNKCRFLLIKV